MKPIENLDSFWKDIDKGKGYLIVDDTEIGDNFT